ncbi:type II toxin-antitoxin system VapC family toxin [bacterium]|nr:type II toxin-antitoxin system VapC family toxin [bacterium]
MFVLDTNTCIFLLNKKPEGVRKRLEGVSLSSVFISSISAYELDSGARRGSRAQENLDRLAGFLSGVQVLSFGLAAAQIAGQISQTLRERGTPIGSMDLLIAAHALEVGAVVVTNNLREFDRVPGLKTVDWLAG